MRGVLVVTGGSRGIGAAIARLGARDGYHVCVNYRAQGEAAEELVGELEQSGGKAIAVQADMAVEADIVRLFNTVDEKLGPVTALANNAGILGGESRVDEVQEDVLHKVFTVNVIGAFLSTREALKRMSTKHGGPGGAIVNLSSLAGRQGGRERRVHYASSKGAMNTFTIGLAKEVATEGVRVNAVLPGMVASDFHVPYGGHERYRMAAGTIPVGRVAQPPEVAELVIWLLSEKASYVTGELIGMTGGR